MGASFPFNALYRTFVAIRRIHLSGEHTHGYSWKVITGVSLRTANLHRYYKSTSASAVSDLSTMYLSIVWMKDAS